MFGMYSYVFRFLSFCLQRRYKAYKNLNTPKDVSEIEVTSL